jgi:hypothetical protein
MNRFFIILALAFFIISCDKNEELISPQASSFKHELAVSAETAVGDPSSSYVNPEFTIDSTLNHQPPKHCFTKSSSICSRRSTLSTLFPPIKKA